MVSPRLHDDGAGGDDRDDCGGGIGLGHRTNDDLVDFAQTEVTSGRRPGSAPPHRAQTQRADAPPRDWPGSGGNSESSSR